MTKKNKKKKQNLNKSNANFENIVNNGMTNEANEVVVEEVDKAKKKPEGYENTYS